MNKKLLRSLCILIACAICFAGSYVLLAGKPIIGPSFAEALETAETGKLEYSDGSSYVGDIKDGEIRNGTGSYSWNTGESYEGTWVEDTLSGSGKMIWPGLGVYEGEFQNGIRQGHGTFTWTYEGTPSDGQPLSFDGEWADDHIGAVGTIVFANLGMYEGEFAKNVRSGIGAFTWDNGDQYYGNWVKDRIEGEGILTLSDGTLYEGTFTNNVLNQGTATYSIDGGIVIRDVRYGKIQSSVSVSYKDGTIVTGKLDKNGEFTGNVTITYDSGDSYVGTLSKGVKSGKGTYKWANGAHYVGEWANDKMSGTGKYYFGEDEKILFLSGKFLDGKPNGTLIYVSEKRLQYNTVWENGKCTSITYKKK